MIPGGELSYRALTHFGLRHIIPCMGDNKDLIADRFSIVDTLYSGRMTDTILAEDLDGRRVVARALKIKALDNWDTVQKLEQRADQYREFSNRSLPELIGTFSDDDDAAFYMVFEQVQGSTLEEYVGEKGPLKDDEVQAMLRDTLEALALLHQSSPEILHGGIRPASVIRSEGGVYRLSELPLPDLPAIPTTSPEGTVIEEAYHPLEQRKGKLVAASDVFSLGMTAVFMLTGKHPHLLPTRRFMPVYRPEGTPMRRLDRVIYSMIEPDAGAREGSAVRLLSMLENVQEVPGQSPVYEPEVTGASGVEIISRGGGESVFVKNEAASRPESMLIGFFLDLWATKPWLIIIVLAALSAGPLLIPALIFLFHPKSKSLINRAFARFRDVTLFLGASSLSVSDQIKDVEYSEIADFRFMENRNAGGIQLETVLMTRDGKEKRFYIDGLNRSDSEKITAIIESRISGV